MFGKHWAADLSRLTAYLTATECVSTVVKRNLDSARNHEIAIEQGVPIALEIVGPNVELKRESVTWSWPIADERACAARVPGGGRDCTNSPKYGDFVVYGNVIMFCEASTAYEAQTRCQAIIKALNRTN